MLTEGVNGNAVVSRASAGPQRAMVALASPKNRPVVCGESGSSLVTVTSSDASSLPLVGRMASDRPVVPEFNVSSLFSASVEVTRGASVAVVAVVVCAGAVVSVVLLRSDTFEVAEAADAAVLVVLTVLIRDDVPGSTISLSVTVRKKVVGSALEVDEVDDAVGVAISSSPASLPRCL